MKRIRIQNDELINLVPEPKNNPIQLYISKGGFIESHIVELKKKAFRHWVEVDRKTKNVRRADGLNEEAQVSYGYYITFQWYAPREESIKKI